MEVLKKHLKEVAVENNLISVRELISIYVRSAEDRLAVATDTVAIYRYQGQLQALKHLMSDLEPNR